MSYIALLSSSHRHPVLPKVQCLASNNCFAIEACYFRQRIPAGKCQILLRKEEVTELLDYLPRETCLAI